MKWGKVIEQNIVWEWRRHYISYKALKKIIRQLKHAQKRNDYEELNQLEFAFNTLVQQDLDDVEAFYDLREAQLLRDFDSLENEEASNQLYQLEKYAYLNGEGFRKIVKKYDKKLSQNASTKFLPIFKSKSFYYHTQIQQLHAKLSRNYAPVVCSYSASKEAQEREVLLRGNNEKSVSLSLCYSDYRRLSQDDKTRIDIIRRSAFPPLTMKQRMRQWLLRYLQLGRHPAIYLTHFLYLLIISLLFCLFLVDIYQSFALKPGTKRNYLAQKLTFRSTTFNAFMFPWLVFSLCSVIVLMVSCGRIQSQRSLYKRIGCVAAIIVTPLLMTLLFGLSPVAMIIFCILWIDRSGGKCLRHSHDVSYEIMFMDQVNKYFYNELLLGNTELIVNDYYSFNVYALRILFLSIVHLYRIDGDDDDIKHMYLEIINRFIDYNDDYHTCSNSHYTAIGGEVDDEDDHMMHHLGQKTLKCLQCFGEIFISENEEFYFGHSNNDQSQSSWLSLVTSFQSYCVILFGILCFDYILWWISFGWSASNLFDSFDAFAVLLQFWAIRDGCVCVLCAAYVAVRHKYLYYVMLYDYSWFHQDLRYMILDNLVVNESNNENNNINESNNQNENNNKNEHRRSMKFEQRFNAERNQHCKFVMDHLMPILRHSQIKETLTEICFHQSWMVNLIMTYSCDFGVYVVVPKPNDVKGRSNCKSKSNLLDEKPTATTCITIN